MSVRLTGEWDSFEEALNDKKFLRRMRKELRKAGTRIGLAFQTTARREISAKAYQENSEVTKLLKGSSTPLVDTGKLFQALTYKVVDGRSSGLNTGSIEVRVGIMLRGKGGGKKLVNLARILHDGATINTNNNPAIRRTVFAKLRDKAGADRMRALNRAQRRGSARPSGIWVIPPRPFIARPLSTGVFRRYARKQWEKAIEHSLFPPKAP